MRVMGIDSSMNNCGYSVFDIRLDPVDAESYKNMSRVAGGTHANKDSKETIYTRIIRNVQKVQDSITEHKPDIIVLEDCLSVGDSKSPTGMATCAMLLQPYHPEGNKHPVHVPKYIVLITPERLQSMAHGERSTKGSVVVQRCKERFKHQKLPRFTEHEGDSMLLAYHGSRFILTSVEKVWPDSMLAEKERWVFLTATSDLMAGRGAARKKIGIKHTSLIKNEGSKWWRNNNDPI